MAETISTATLDFAMTQRYVQKLKDTEFVLDFLERSADKRAPSLELAEEIMENKMVTSEVDRGQRWVPKFGSSQMATRPGGNLRGGRYRSKLKSPKTSQIIDDLVSQAVGLLTDTPEFIQVVPVGLDDPIKAKFVGRLLMALFQAPGISRTIHEMLADAFTFGVSVVELGWETRSRMQTVLRPIIDPDLGMEVGRETGSEEVIYRDGPMIRMVDLWDFYPDPSGYRIQENMQGVAKRFRMTKQEAIRMAEAGVFNKDDVRQAVLSPAESGGGGGKERDRYQDLSVDTVDDYGVMTGFEWWGEVPYRAPGGRNRVITILNGIHVRSHLNPFIDGAIPFKEVVINPVPGRFMGLSPAEVIRFLQDSADSLLMTLTDSADMAARNVLLMGRGANFDPQRLASRKPGDVIMGGNPDQVVPIPFDTNTLGFATQEYLRREIQMAEASGANNPLQALKEVGKRSAATTSSEIVRLASQKTELMVRLIERNDLPFIGKTIHARMRQFLDPQRQEMLVGEQFPVTLDDVDFPADIRFVGSRTAMSKGQKVAATREAINVLMSNPAAAFYYPKLISKYLEDDLGYKEAAEWVEEARNAFIQMQQLQMQQAQMSASGAGNVPGTNTAEDFGTDAGETENQGAMVA